MSSDPRSVVESFIDAINNHDVEAVAACFASDYQDEAPARRGERVQGRESARENFARLFRNIPDIRAELLGVLRDGSTVWMEWRMRGARTDGSPFEFVGVNIFEIRNDVLARGRIYTELVRDGGGIDAQLERMLGNDQQLQNKDLVWRLIEEVFGKGNLETVDELVANNFIDHTAPPGMPPGPDGVKQVAIMFQRAFPEWSTKVDGMIAEKDVVVFWGTGRGAHQGEFMGVPATGKEISVPGIHVIRITDGKIVEHRSYNDQLGTLRQLGALQGLHS